MCTTFRYALALTLFTAVALGLSIPAHAAFINGVESFPGTTLDTNTWEIYPPDASVFTQDNGLIADNNRNIQADITTRHASVGIGQSVRAGVEILRFGYGPTDYCYTGLFLTNNSARTSSTLLDDSRTINIENGYFGITGSIMWNRVGQFRGPFPAQPLNVHYNWQIDRLTRYAVRYTVTDASGSVLWSVLHNTDFDNTVPKDYPNYMYVSLFLQGNTKVRFTDVTIIPEPASLSLLLLLTLPALSRPRRH